MEKKSILSNQKSKIKAVIPATFVEERSYILTVFAKDFCHLPIEIEINDRCSGNYLIMFKQQQLKLPDIFFPHHYTTPSQTMPQVSMVEGLRGKQPSLPAWFTHSETSNSAQKLSVDILGMAFFLLTGYADLTYGTLDKHLRYEGNTSFVVLKGLIDRPIIQEWFIELATRLLSPNPTKKNFTPPFRKHISHDVDQPLEYLNYGVHRLIKRVSADVLIRKNPSLAFKRASIWNSVRKGNPTQDPFNNISSLIDLLHKFGVRSTFFWGGGTKNHLYDVTYSLDHPIIQSLLRSVVESNHHIGLHPSYLSLGDTHQITHEKEILERYIHRWDSSRKVHTVRKHVLRWDWKESPQALSDAGITDDYSIGYADRAGFRVGVAFPYRAWNWKTKQECTLSLHPLIFMECTLLDAHYMGLSVEETRKKMRYYTSTLRKLGGEMVLLWHNHRLARPHEFQLFTEFLSL